MAMEFLWFALVHERTILQAYPKGEGGHRPRMAVCLLLKEQSRRARRLIIALSPFVVFLAG
jgi:hypothetical protein